ncbi:hypothetical protein ZWY2020_021485 [Hordeum vulgare]|nr:hypothetical protein ZWY2020_021485 [Hordeum vulgare]
MPSLPRAVPDGRGCEPVITAAFRPHYQVVAPDDLVFSYNGGGLLVPQVTSSPSSSSYHQQQQHDVVAQLLHEAVGGGALLPFGNRSSNSDEYRQAHCSLAEEQRRRRMVSNRESARAVTAVLLVLCAVSCAFSAFTDSFGGADDKVRYGLVTPRGLLPFGGDDDDGTGEQQKQVVMALPVVIGALASVVFVVFSSKRHSIGYPPAKPAASSLASQ